MKRALAVSLLVVVLAAGLLTLISPPRPQAGRQGATHRLPAGKPADEKATIGAPAASGPGPAAVVSAFARRYVNWNSDDLAATLRGLAAQSVGQAHSAMALAAAQDAGDSALAQEGVANRGTVEAVAPLRGHPEQYAVVTLETTSATDDPAYEGLPAAWHVTVATVTRVGGRWTLSAWQPES